MEVKRVLQWVGVAVALLVVLAGAGWYSAFGNNSPVVEGPIADGVEVVKDGFANIFLVDAGPGKVARGVLFFGDSAGASKTGQVMKAVSLFSKDSPLNVASLKALTARLGPREAEIKAMAFGHTGSLVGFEPLKAFAARD
jgi:hypothetical protein